MRINKTVLYLTISDIFAWGPYNIIATLAGVYLAYKLGENTAQFIGIGTSIYYISRAVFQIPIGYLNDKYNKDRDEILLLFIGILLMGASFIFYPQISQPIHYYILQFIFGLGVSLNVINWRKLFAMNIDKGREGMQYGIYDTVLSLSTALISVVAGVVANMGSIYFDLVMCGSGIVIMLGNIWVVLVYLDKERKTYKNK